MTLRVEIQEPENPFLSAKLLLRFVKCKRALVVPRDINRNTVVILDADDSIAAAEKLKKVKMGITWNLLAQSFEEIVSQSKQSLQKKSIFLVSSQTKEG